MPGGADLSVPGGERDRGERERVDRLRSVRRDRGLSPPPAALRGDSPEPPDLGVREEPKGSKLARVDAATARGDGSGDAGLDAGAGRREAGLSARSDAGATRAPASTATVDPAGAAADAVSSSSAASRGAMRPRRLPPPSEVAERAVMSAAPLSSTADVRRAMVASEGGRIAASVRPGMFVATATSCFTSSSSEASCTRAGA